MKVEMDKVEKLEFNVLVLQKEVDDMKRIISQQTETMNKMVDLLVEIVYQDNNAVGYSEAYYKLMNHVMSKPTKENKRR